MKKLVCLFMLVLAVSACSLYDEPKSEIVTLPVESVVLPTVFKVNVVDTIKIKYRRPTNCHFFDSFYYEKIDNIRVVAINAVKLNQKNCDDASADLFEIPLNFKPIVTGPYIFKFFTGTNPDGVDQFLTYNIEVTE